MLIGFAIGVVGLVISGIAVAMAIQSGDAKSLVGAGLGFALCSVLLIVNGAFVSR